VKKIVGILVLAALAIGSCAEKEARGKPIVVPAGLRGGIKADAETIAIAVSMRTQGWCYVMPVPKSPQASWHNRDGRTTWWRGYWRNNASGTTSLGIPERVDGKYVGDARGGRSWRRGGSPGRPSELQWLLSESGGISPH
jgi:hypothetical protein